MEYMFEFKATIDEFVLVEITAHKTIHTTLFV
jgi:hypothetical protein